jgi:hypothetical protein
LTGLKELVMKKASLPAIRTVCGAIFHCLCGAEREIFEREWSILSSHLEIAPDTIYSIELSGFGSVLQTKELTLRYHHDNFGHDTRVIEIIYGKKKHGVIHN